MKLDTTDKRILSLLGEDGRMAYSSIAKVVGLTSTAVSQRVQRMSDDGIIKGFGLSLDLEKLGYSIQTIITVKLDFSKRQAFYEALKTFDEIDYAYRITGEDCIILKANLRDNAHLLEFINEISNYGLSKSSIVIERIA